MGLERSSGGLEDWERQVGRRGSWEGTGGLPPLPFGLRTPLGAEETSFLQIFVGLLGPELVPLLGLNSRPRALCSTLCSQCRSPREWERFQCPVACGGPSRSSQLRLAGMGGRLWAFLSPSRLKPFREGLMKKFLENFVRWLLLLCRASVDRVMGRVG